MNSIRLALSLQTDPPQSGISEIFHRWCRSGVLAALFFVAASHSEGGFLVEIEPNDTLATAQAVTATSFTLDSNNEIADAIMLPHVTVYAPGAAEADYDYFRVEITQPNSRLIADIDHAWEGNDFFDSHLAVFCEDGTLVAENGDAPITEGREGSSYIADAFLDITGLPAGIYVIGVGRFYPNSVADGGFTGGYPVPALGSYDLQISIGVSGVPAVSEGYPDPEFGLDGVALGSIDGWSRGVAVQADGGILVVGQESQGSMVLARYLADGTLDGAFGGNGQVTTDVDGGDTGDAVAVQADGKIVVVGSSWNGSSYNVYVTRHLATGALDSSFSGDGKVITAMPNGYSFGKSVAIQPDGKILVAATYTNGSDRDILLLRFLTNGSPDPAFGTGGQLVVPVSDEDEWLGQVLLQDDGKILVVGQTIDPADLNNRQQFLVLRLNSDGSFDTTFSGDGKVMTLIDQRCLAKCVALQPDGKILVGGGSYYGSSYRFALARYTSTGQLDSSFLGGVVNKTVDTSHNGFITGISVQPDGKIVVAGNSGQDVVLTRYYSFGFSDSGFGSGGLVTATVSNLQTESVRMVTQPDGDIVVSGQADAFTLLRFVGEDRVGTVGFTDTNFEAAIRDRLQIPSGDILTTNMETPVTLDLSSEAIEDINGLETATNLEVLNLRDNYIEEPEEAWALLDTLSLEVIIMDDPRPGGAAADFLMEEFVDLYGRSFVIMVDLGTSHVLDLTNLEFDWVDTDNVAALQRFQNAGISFDTGGENLAPLARANYWIVDHDIPEITLDGGLSTDLDGTITNYFWNWTGGSTSGENVTIALPEGVATVTLTVFDDDFEEGQYVLDVSSAIEGNWSYVGRQEVPVPDSLSIPQTMTKASAGAYFSVGLRQDGRVIACGSNGLGGSTDVPEAAESGVVEVAAGIGHVVVRKSDGSVVAWGWNNDGQATVPVAAQSGVEAVSAGSGHSLAAKSDGSVISWGDFTSVPSAAQSGVIDVAAGQRHSLALKSDGSVYAWGIDSSGETSVPPEALSGVTDIAAGLYHSVAVKDGSVIVWGNNNNDINTVPPRGQSGVEEVSCRWDHILARKSDGSVVAWGRNDSGQCDVPVEAMSGVVAIATGQDFSIAVKSDGSTVCWGANESGQCVFPKDLPVSVEAVAMGTEHSIALLNDGSVAYWGTSGPGYVDIPVAAQSGVMAIDASGSQNLALKSDGSVVKWGRNLGVESVPVEVQSGVTSIACGYQHGLALKSGGIVFEWGSNETIPPEAQGGVVTKIAANGRHSMVLTNVGRVVAWGQNYSGESDVPAEALSGITEIAAGNLHSVALTDDGRVLVWGDNDYGQSTVPPEALTGVIAISAGQYHTTALKRNGTMVSWGGPDYGETRVPPSSFMRVREIVAGGNTTFFKIGTQVSPTVVFADAALEAALRANLGITDGSVTEIDMESLTELDLSGAGVADLAGLEKALNLRVLKLTDNTLTDPSAAWVLLDGMTLHAVHYDSPRPGGDPSGMLTQVLTNTSAQNFRASVDIINLANLDITGLDIDLAIRDNMVALQAISDAGVTLDTGGVNLPPIAVASHSIINTETGEVQFDGSGSGDIDGSLSDYSWAWTNGGTSGPTPLAVIPPGLITVTLTVTDNDGATGQTSIVVDLPVRFADSALEDGIRAHLGIPTDPIEVTDMQTITSLDLFGLGISDLSGLETATNLHILDLLGNSFSDPSSAWAILDGLPLHQLYMETARPGGDPPGLLTRTVCDIWGLDFLVSLDVSIVTVFDITNLNLDSSVLATITALQDLQSAGVTIDNGGVNFQPAAVPAYTVVDGAVGQVSLDGSASADFDGTITTYVWTWTGGSAIGVNPTVSLSQGSTVVTLLVIDDGGSSAANTLTVDLIPDIAVEEPVDNDLENGLASVDFGPVVIGLNAVKTFTIRNTGTGNLNGIQVEVVELDPEPFINEFHYWDGGSDQEFVEVAGLAGTDLSSWRIAFYHADGSWRTNQSFGGGAVILDDGNGYGVFSRTINNIPNQPGAIAIFDQNRGDLVVDFISYGGTGPVMAVGGPADGMEATDSGLFEDGSTFEGDSLQLEGLGSRPSDFLWSGPISSSPGSINSSQTIEASGVGGPFSVDITGLASSLAPNAIITFTVDFSPSSAGDLESTLNVTSDDPDENLFEIQLIGTGEAPVPVSIPDAALEAALRDILEIPSGALHVHEIEILITLELNDLGITNLDGLQYALGLELLDLRGNPLADPTAAWTLLDGLPLHQLFIDQARPGGDPPGRLTEVLTDTLGSAFHASVDPASLGTFDISGLSLDLGLRSNIAALVNFAAAGISIDSGGVNLPPLAVGASTVLDALIGQVQLDAGEASDIDGSVASYSWTWAGGSATTVNPTVILPLGNTTVTLTVTDDGGTTGIHVFEVALPVLIVDGLLESAIRNRLGIPIEPIYQADMEALTDLDLGWLGVDDLTGLEYASNLRELHLRGNPLGNASALGSLTIHLFTVDTPPFSQGSFPGLDVQTVTDTNGVPFLIAVDAENLASLDITGLNIDLGERANLIELESISNAGVSIDNGGENLPPIPRGSLSILNATSGEVRLYGYLSSDIDGSISSHHWTWGSEFESGILVDVFLPLGDTEVTLSVTDNDGATSQELIFVSLPINIPDSALVDALQAELGGITESDLLLLSEIDLSDLGIADLTGLEYATNLRVLDVRENPFTNTAVAWSILDQLSLDRLLIGTPRAGGDVSGHLTQALVDSNGDTYYLVLDLSNSPVLDITGMDIDTSVASNLQSLQVFIDAGVTLETGGVNLPPAAVASANVTDPATGAVQLDGSDSFSLGGGVTSYEWAWEGGSSSDVSPVITLPGGTTIITLTVTAADSQTSETTVEVVIPSGFSICFDLGNLGTRTSGGELMQIVYAGDAAVEPVFDVASGWSFIAWDTTFDDIQGNLIVTAQYDMDSQGGESEVFFEDFEAATTGQGEWANHGGWSASGDSGGDEIRVRGDGSKYAQLGFYAPTGGSDYTRRLHSVGASGDKFVVEQLLQFAAPANGVYDNFYIMFFNQDGSFIGRAYFNLNATDVSFGISGNGSGWVFNYSSLYRLRLTLDYANNTVDMALGDNPPFATGQTLSSSGLPLNMGSFGYVWTYDSVSPGNGYMFVDDVKVLKVIPPGVIGRVNEIEPNNDFAGAFELFEEAFTLDADADIADSTTVPHVSVIGTGDGSFDYYKITLDLDNSKLTVDVDYTSSHDSYIAVWDSTGAPVSFNDDSNLTDGAEGSTSGYDSFLALTGLDAGTYYIGVAAYSSSNSVIQDGFSAGSNPVGTGAAYELQVSTDSFIPGIPEISVAVLGADVVSGGAPLDLGAGSIMSPGTPVTFTVRNDGTDKLNCLAILVGGINAGDIAVDDSSVPASLDPGATADFTLIFSPGGLGDRSANLRISSNDADESPFIVNLIGTGDDSIVFGDPNLEAAIRSALNIPSGTITVGDMAGLTTPLDLSNLGITDLSGLEFATNLRILNIRGNPFSDAVATWAILDQLSLYCLYTDLPRPGGDSPGLITQAVTTNSSDTFYIVVDDESLPTLDIVGLDIDISEQSNLDALQVFADAGVVVVDTGSNLPPTARATATVVNTITGEIDLVGSTSSDIDGTISNYSWIWSGGSATGATASVTLPPGQIDVTLTVTDDGGLSDSVTIPVTIDGPSGTDGEYLVNFGATPAGSGWNQVTAAMMNSGSANPLTDSNGNSTGVTMRGFANLDPTLTAADASAFSIENPGTWNAGMDKEWVVPAAVADYIFGDPNLDFFFTLSGLDPAKQYQLEVISASDTYPLDLAFTVYRKMDGTVLEFPDGNVEGTTNGGGVEWGTSFGVSWDALAHGWAQENWVMWDAIAPGVDAVTGIAPILGLNASDLVIGISGDTTSEWAINALRITEIPSGVTFGDPNLEAAIRSALNIPSGTITVGDMAGLTTPLDLSNLGITDLSGLEFATNLNILNIRGNPFSDAVATWAILDQLSLYCLYTDLPRPGGDSPGLITQAVTTNSSDTFYIVVDDESLPTLDISGLDIDTSQQSNLDALQVFEDAGVTVEGIPPVNEDPTAAATHTVIDIASRQVFLDASDSSDTDGSITTYAWTWSGSSSSGVSPTVTLPIGSTQVTLTVTDNQGATDAFSFTVNIVDLNLAYSQADLTGEDAQPDATPYNDGVPNLLKYAFNMNLAGSDSSTLDPDTGSSGLPTYELDDSGPETVVRVQYIRRKGSGLDYTPMKSGDLSAGSFVPMNGSESTEYIDGEFERVTVVAPCDPATEPSCFWQVRVTLP